MKAKQVQLQCYWISLNCSTMAWLWRRGLKLGDLGRGREKLCSDAIETDRSLPSSRRVSRVRELSIDFFLKLAYKSKNCFVVSIILASCADSFRPVSFKKVLQISYSRSCMGKSSDFSDRECEFSSKGRWSELYCCSYWTNILINKLPLHSKSACIKSCS